MDKKSNAREEARGTHRLKRRSVGRGARSISLTGVSQDKVVEFDLARHLASGREQADQEFAEVVGSNTVEVVLAFAPRFDESRNAE